jgi:hypothetical protein
MVVTLSVMDMDVNSVHSLNTPIPMVLTLDGMVILVKLEHLKNRYSLISISLSDKLIDIKLEHSLNAPWPINVTLLGMIKFINPEQPSNA